MEWHEIRMNDIKRIDRIVAEFDIWVDGSLPFAKFKIKIIERYGKGFYASPNVAIKNPHTGNPEFIGGLGSTLEEALQDALAFFWREIEQNSPRRRLVLEDFSWSAGEDF